MNQASLHELNIGYQAALGLVFFRSLRHQVIFKSWFNLVQALLEDKPIATDYYEFLAQISPLALNTSGDAWEHYIDQEILLTDNELSRRLQTAEPVTPTLQSALERETDLLRCIRRVNAAALAELGGQQLAVALPVAVAWKQPEIESCLPTLATDDLSTLYRQFGSGSAAIYPILRWNPQLGMEGVAHPDQVTLDSLVGYQRQKDALITNTLRLLSGLPSQHTLLYGPRGSGKSSLIKAVAQLFFKDQLRLIEVATHDLESLPAIVDYVRGRCQYFIIFIDDLSFEAYETGYKSLKNLLEGGVEDRPANLVVYATSNRRHIIQENYSDRLDGDDLHPGETRQEKLALADRFGLSIYFPSANQELYLEMVMAMADRRGINLPEAELISRALTWEKEKSGPSGRAARQFVDSL